MEESTAVKLSQSGDITAFNVLVDNHYKNIYRFAYQFTGSHQDADDICQETFLKVFDKIGQLKDSRSFQKWIFMIAANVSRKWIQKAQRNIIHESKAFSNKLSYNSQPYVEIACEEKSAIIQKHLEEMPESLRMVTVLVLIEDFSQKEAAKILDRSEPSISRDLNNSRIWLKSRLKDLL